MKKNYYILLLLILTSMQMQSKLTERKISFDNDWRFCKRTIIGAERANYDDSLWRTLDLPHDWSIEPLENQTSDKVVGPFSRESAGGFATGQTVGGEGWYRKSFIIRPEDANLRHELYFEGVYNQAEIWINGQKVYRNVYGYTSFRVDITKYCNPAGENNVVAVKVLNEGRNSRWYSGSGIYRHVWMIRTSPAYIEDWSTFVRTTSLVEGKTNIELNTSIINSNAKVGNYTVKVQLLSPKGKVVALENKMLNISGSDTLGIHFTLRVKNPELWSVEKPLLYTVCISLWNDKIKEDEYSVPFGIRTLRFSVDKGFELNGVPLKMKGGCVHHDNGLLGAAAFDRAEERKIELLKKNGFNAVRTSHNPMSESFLNACDRLGVLVINEAFDQWKGQKNPQDYHLYFEEWSARDIESLVRRDRNHPSVIMWSIGNEIRERANDDGMAIAEYLKKEIQKYDNTRPVTAGINKSWDKGRKNMISLDKAYKHLDVVGHNYMWRFYEDISKKYPGQLMYGSESVAMEASENWDMVEKYPFVMGDFVWTALDYLGESGLGNSLEISPEENVHQFMDWPWYGAWCGDIDLLGVKKPQSYYRDVLWRERKISMAVEAPIAKGKIRKVSFWGWTEELLSWTFPGMENKEMKVNVYTRASKVKLYLNNVLVGETETSDRYKASFSVPYQPGELKAVALNGKNLEASTVLETVGEPVTLRLVADKVKLKADGQDLSFIHIEQVDKHGKLVYTPSRKIKITSQGDSGRIIASGNASPNDMPSFQSMTPTLFQGRAMVIVRSGKEKGKITVQVTADGLKSANITIISN